MPYCAKCGVEVNNDISTCPLCEFPIPNIDDYNKDITYKNSFPKAENIYRDRVETIKNSTFFTIVLFLILTIPILLSIKAYYPPITKGINYAIVSVIAAVFYLFFIFGYLTIKYNILGLGITSLLFTYVLDNIDESITWFYKYAILIIILVMIISYIYVYLYKRSRHYNQLVYVTAYIFSGIGILCIGVEAIISYRLNNTIKLTWSIIVFLCSLAVCVLILGLYHGLPERVRNEIKRKLHV